MEHLKRYVTLALNEEMSKNNFSKGTPTQACRWACALFILRACDQLEEAVPGLQRDEKLESTTEQKTTIKGTMIDRGI
jgi:hypothetical protein